MMTQQVRDDGAVVQQPALFRWASLDSIVLASLIAFSAMYAALHVQWHVQPFEDALMLLRYAEHLAGGAGIVWNVGDGPVEGATDFLFMVAIAGLMKVTGLHAILACRLILLTCHALGTGLLYFGTRKIFSAGRVLAASLALFYAAAPGVLYVTGGFSPPFYALFVMGAWYFACEAVVDGPGTVNTVGMGVFALLTGLTRPDGVFLVFFFGVAVWFAIGRSALRMLAIAGSIFIVFGGAYFAWRYHYFGYLLPNPFYKKGGGHLYPESLRRSLSNTLKLIFPVAPILWFAVVRRGQWRRVMFVLIPVVCFTCLWLLLTTENNWNARFQFIALPITLFALPYVMKDERRQANDDAAWPLWASLSTVCAVFFAATLYWKMAMPPPSADGSSMHDIAVDLSPYASKGYTMAVTEAGTLPYFSGWRAIDAWGLNDPQIVHDPKGMTDAYLDESKPAVIMFHMGNEDFPAGFDHTWFGDGGPVQGAARFNGPLSHYAVTHDYELVARWGPQPCNLHVWYLRRDIPDFEAIKAILLRQPHYYLDGGMVATNYLQAEPPKSCGDPGEHLDWQE